MIKFKCDKCGCEKYKIIYWKLKRGENTGVYCFNCGRWLKFLGGNEEMYGKPEITEVKYQRHYLANCCLLTVLAKNIRKSAIISAILGNIKAKDTQIALLNLKEAIKSSKNVHFLQY